MTFLNLSLLGGAALVALPVLLHLIMRRKPRRWEFPALRFVRQRHDVNQRQMRLRHLLLLLLRMLAIALLAMALARPSIKFSGVLGSQEGPVAAAMVFDTSVRMDYRHENRTRLEAAREFGAWLLAQLPRESQIAVLDTRGSPAVFQVDRGAAGDRIARLESAAYALPLPRVIEDAVRLVAKSELARKEVYVFTDLAQTAWPPDAAARLQDRLAELAGVGLYLIDVGVELPTNVRLGEIRLSSQVLSSRSGLDLSVEVTATGESGPRSVELYLLGADRKPQRRAVQPVEFKQGQAQQANFRVGALDVGTHQGFVRIAGQDGLAADDTQYFTVEVRPPWNVLAVAPSPAESYALFLTEALAPEDFRKQGRARFDCQIVDVKQLAQQKLNRYAAVCVLDPPALEAASWQKLADYAADGHGVAIFLGRNATPIEAFNTPNAQAVLPGKLMRQARRPDGDNHLFPQSYEHPLLKAFGVRPDAIPWSLFPVFRYWELGPANPGTSVVLGYSDDRPAILQRTVGQGRVLTMTTPISDRPDRDAWNLLPAGDAGPFLILMNQMMGYLVGSTEQQLNYTAGQTALLTPDRQAAYPSYVVSTPQGLQVTVSPNPQRNVIEFSATEQTGPYRVQAGGSEAGSDRGFSVNLPPDQTRLDRLTPDKLKELFGPFEFRLARSTSQLDRAVSSGRVGRELFPFLIVILAVVLGLELLVANRFYKEA